MKLKFVLIGLFLLLFLVQNVNAWSETEFNNSLGEENLTIPGLINSINDSFESVYSGWDVVSGSTGWTTGSCAYDGTYCLWLVTAGGTEEHEISKTMTIQSGILQIRYGLDPSLSTNFTIWKNDNFIIDLTGSGFVDGGRYYNITFNVGDIISLRKSNATTGSLFFDNFQFFDKTVRYLTIPESVDIITNAFLNISGLNTTGTYPVNVSLEIDNIQVWNYTGEFNQSNNRTSNIASAINSYLSGCSIVNGFCLVPFIFYSDSIGILQYLDMLFNDETTDFTVATSCNDTVYHFDFKDEENQTSLSGATINYNFKYGINNGTANSIYGTLTGLSSFEICINATQAPNWTIGEGEIQYSINNYADRRYYIFDDSTATNITTNITLYNLFTASQTSFKLEVIDTSLSPYADKFTTLLRWYPQFNEYRIVGMSKTDENGESVIHVKTENVDYRIGVYERNGSLIKVEDPTRFVCLVNPCTYTLKISPTDVDFTSFFDVEYTFTYNTTTGIWTFIYSDSSQNTDTMNLTIYKITGTSVFSVCSDTATGYTGVLSCNTSAYTGKLKGVVVRSASPDIPIAQKVITTTSTAFSSSFGLWLSLLIGLPIVFIFSIMSPVAATIGGVIMLLPALYFGAVNWAIVGGVAILAGIVMHFLKRIG